MNMSITEWFLWLFHPLLLGSNKRSFTFKQICSFERQVCISFYDLWSPRGMKGFKEKAYKNAFYDCFTKYNILMEEEM